MIFACVQEINPSTKSMSYFARIHKIPVIVDFLFSNYIFICVWIVDVIFFVLSYKNWNKNRVHYLELQTQHVYKC